MKTFIHKFKNGEKIKLEFDLSKPKVSCKSSMRMENQSKEILKEYKIWQLSVVLPEIMSSLSKEQICNIIMYGYEQQA